MKLEEMFRVLPAYKKAKKERKLIALKLFLKWILKEIDELLIEVNNNL